MKFELSSEHLASIRAHTRDDESARALQSLIERILQQTAEFGEQAEQRMRQGERLYRMLINSVPNTAVILFDRELRFRLAEGDALNAVGIMADQIEGRTLREVLPEYSATFLEPYYRRTLAGETQTLEIDYVEGHVYQVRFTPIFDGAQVSGGMLYVQDVAAGRRMERMLREEEARYRSLVEAQAELVCRFRPDTTLTFVNDSYCRFFDKLPTDLIGETFMNFVPDSGREASLAQIAQLIAAPSEVLFAENRLIDSSGAIRWIEWVSRAITDENGAVVEIQASGRDITERKQAEIALRESEERFRQIAENVREAFFILDVRSGQFLYVSPQYQLLTGYSVDALYDNPLHLITITHPDDQERVLKAAEANLQRGQFFNEQHRIYRADGALRWLWGRNFPIHNSEGEMYRVVGIIEDITERKQQEEQTVKLALEQQRIKLLTDFVTSASHEFRTPLSLINMSLYLMTRANEPERRAEFGLRIQREVDKIAQLVDHLLLMTRLDSEISIHQGTVDLNEVVELAYVSHEGSIRQKGHRYAASLAPDLPSVTGDVELLRRAVSALLQNAIQYTDPSGAIEVRTQAEGENVVVSVKDNGIGIGEAALPLIFNRFFREDASHSTSGFGLGLSIARRVAELHNGTITVQSEMGRGSQFALVLPAAPNAKA